jgi:lysophospholipase L1-like esterase
VVKPRSFAAAVVISFAASAVASSMACTSDEEAAPGLVPTQDAGTLAADAALGPAADAAGDADTVAKAPYHLVGRFDVRDPAGPRFSWSGTQIRAAFSGTGLVVKLKDSGQSQFDVAIDGAKPTLLVPGASDSHEVATGLAPGEHTVVITKRTEPTFGTTQFLGFEPKDGALVPTPAPGGKLIEMVGDSITAGYGILGFEPCKNAQNQDNSFSPETESETEAWGALAATELGARHHAVAWSGIGVYRDNNGDQADPMPVRYDRALGEDGASTWDHSKAHPDLVVVNLGTNDFATGDPGVPFQTAYVAFLKSIRDKHPEAFIAVATSPMLTDSYPEPPANEQRRTKSIAALEAIVAARKTAGDAKVASLTIDEQQAADLYGCDSHPSKDTAKKMAGKLVAFAKTTLGW